MTKKRVTRYIAECGKGFWNKNSCASHEINCRCWTNPIFKTCKTCIFGKNVRDNNGMEDEPQFLDTWRQWECSNPKFNYDIHFKPAHKNAPDLNINCPVWQNKKLTN